MERRLPALPGQGTGVHTSPQHPGQEDRANRLRPHEKSERVSAQNLLTMDIESPTGPPLSCLQDYRSAPDSPPSAPTVPLVRLLPSEANIEPPTTSRAPK